MKIPESRSSLTSTSRLLKGVPYEFQDAQQLMIDFFSEVDRVLKEIGQK
jgi:hypothetical protein